MATANEKCSSEEIARRGDEIYNDSLRERLEIQHFGKIVAIDVDSCDYAVADTILEASDQVLARHPNAEIYLLRVGDEILAPIPLTDENCESMIAGTVNARLEATISLHILAPQGRMLELEAIVDTGFSGLIALPPHIISALQLPRAGIVRAQMGDGTETVLDLYKASIIWDGQVRSVEVDGIFRDVLVGTALLRGYELRASFTEQGAVQLRQVP